MDLCFLARCNVCMKEWVGILGLPVLWGRGASKQSHEHYIQSGASEQSLPTTVEKESFLE